MTGPAGAPAVRVYLWSERKTNAAMLAARGLFDGFWLGVLDDDALARIDETYYSGQPMYEATDYNRSGLSAWERRAVERHFADVVDVVVTSAGGGREVVALSELGFHACGYEPHERLVRFARTLSTSEGNPILMEVSDRDRWPVAATGADGVVVGWGGYMLIRGRAARLAFLRSAAAALPVGGPVLLSFFSREGPPARRLRATVRVANPIRRLLRREPLDLGDALVPNRVHFFSRDEIEQELAEAGFEMVDFGSEEYGWAVGRKIGRGDD